MSTNNHLNHSLILTVLLLITFATKTEQSKQIPALYVFGDSFVDCGNNHNVDFFPYGIDFGTPTGRCTNGKTVADFLAIYLGLPFAPAYLGLSNRVITTGINYASAGSGILPDTNNEISFIMDEQIRGFERTVKEILPKGLGEEAVEKHVSESLFFLSSGVNDHFKNNTFRGSRKFASYLINEFKIRLQMTEWVTPVFQHGGSFVKDNKGELLYLNGNVTRYPPMDLDLVNYFDLKKLFEEFGYHEFKKTCWYDPRAPSMEAGLHPIYGDKEIREMCDAKREDKETDELYLFFDHPIMEDVEWSEEDEMNLSQGDDGNNSMNEEHTDDDREAEVWSDDPISDGDSYDSYESAEDEAYKPPPPGFESDTDDDEDELLINLTKRKGDKGDKKAGKKKIAKNVRKNAGPKVTVGPTHTSRPNNTAGPKYTARPTSTAGHGIGEVDSEIFSDESDGLGFESEGFDTPQSSDNEGDGFDWPQFNEEAAFGEVQLQLNMEFTTIEQFKKALKDYTIAEGRRIFYVKNDKKRVRCKCANGEEKAMNAKAKSKDIQRKLVCILEGTLVVATCGN